MLKHKRSNGPHFGAWRISQFGSLRRVSSKKILCWFLKQNFQHCGKCHWCHMDPRCFHKWGEREEPCKAPEGLSSESHPGFAPGSPKEQCFPSDPSFSFCSCVLSHILSAGTAQTWSKVLMHQLRGPGELGEENLSSPCTIYPINGQFVLWAPHISILSE